MKTAFQVIGSNPSNEGKTHVWKLSVTSIAKIFGIEKTVKRTYYIGGMPAAGVVDTVFHEDMDKFEIVERPFDFVGDDGVSVTVMLKWLHVKVA